MIELAMGQRPRITPRAQRQVANIEFLRMPAGRVESVLGVPQASAVADVAAIMFNVKPGDEVGPIEDKDQRPGYIVALSQTSPAAVSACEQAKALLRVCMQGKDQPLPLS